MDIIDKLALEVFENRQSYTTNDYLVIMNILMEQYNRINGVLPSYTNEKEIESDDEVEDDISYSNYYADDSEGYLSDYIETY